MDKISQLLIHYMRHAWEKAGLKWTNDNDSEMREIVKLIIDEAADQSMKREHVEVILRQYGLIT